mmetsp:Transcript_55015/g.61462  ORF Transcript_55015/g.61462 Transcript_55015/m.61462 type:complete len:579 (+) Transcript_55015:49-1785(+)
MMKSRNSGRNVVTIRMIRNVVSHSLVGLICLYIGLIVGMGNNMMTGVEEVVPIKNRRDEEINNNNINIDRNHIFTPPDQPEQPKQPLKYLSRKRPFPLTSDKMFVDYATVPRKKFNDMVDMGVPVDYTKDGAEDVLVLYTSTESLPKNMGWHNDKIGLDASKALENCHTVKVILHDPAEKGHERCIAIVPQWESYTVHKWMRVEPRNVTSVDLNYPLKNVPRSRQANGKVLGYGVPTKLGIANSYELLVDYLQNLDRVLADLRTFLRKIMRKASNPSANTLVILTCNKGQSIMFQNFVCNARAKELDLSHIVMFATDEATVKLSNDLGIHVWYDEAIFGSMPENSAQRYGDKVFGRMMMAKVYCMHLALTSGYDVLFQDVDIVWHRNPLQYLLSEEFEEWDMMFQDDGSRQPRFAPYSPNSGFYFVRSNSITKYFFDMLLRMGDMIQVAKSHQAVLNDLLIEFSSWKGLRVKVFRKGPDNLFPGGSEFHNNPAFMKEFLNGKRQPYIQHMSWTENKENKKLFFEQLGEWYTVEDTNSCTGMNCCLPEPNITCHYRDKPSKISCPNSPTIVENGGKSFW